jgi:hypothetical protein
MKKNRKKNRPSPVVTTGIIAGWVALLCLAFLPLWTAAVPAAIWLGTLMITLRRR